MNNSKAILHLSLIEGVGPVTIKTVLASGIEPVDLYACGSRDLVERCGVSLGVAQKLVAGLASQQELDNELWLLEKHQVQWAALGSSEYSELLAAIHAPPAVVYWRGGNHFNEQKTIAFVGSRQAHRYAEQVINTIVPDLVDQGWIIVSGGALGADSMAHRAAVRARGATVAVIGSGLLHPYPASNRYLFDEIVASGGALVSCFPLETEAMPGLFPARNRIIAGMSRGCVVVQAAAKSGALITAHCALEQGREVFAVPGPIGDELSAGCNELIQQGAKLICGAADISSEFEWFKPTSTDTPDKAVGSQEDGQSVSGAVAAAGSVGRDLRNRDGALYQKGASRLPAGPANLEPTSIKFEEASTEGKILLVCAQPSTIDDIVLVLHENVDVVQGLLFELQLSGKLKQNFAGLWERL